jgi:hypothetical protein
MDEVKRVQTVAGHLVEELIMAGQPKGRGLKAGRWTREMHESAAISTIRAWQHAAILRPTDMRYHPGPGQCGRSSTAQIIKANRAVAQARVHLASIGPAEGKRTKQLWRQVGVLEKKLAVANKYLAMCVGSAG